MIWNYCRQILWNIHQVVCICANFLFLTINCILCQKATSLTLVRAERWPSSQTELCVPHKDRILTCASGSGFRVARVAFWPKFIKITKVHPPTSDYSCGDWHFNSLSRFWASVWKTISWAPLPQPVSLGWWFFFFFQFIDFAD